MINTLSQTRALFDCIKPMEPFPTIPLTRQEMERAALDLGAKFQTIRQWRYRNIPTRWQLKLIKHFGAMIVIDDVASADLPPEIRPVQGAVCGQQRRRRAVHWRHAQRRLMSRSIEWRGGMARRQRIRFRRDGGSGYYIRKSVTGGRRKRYPSHIRQSYNVRAISA